MTDAYIREQWEDATRRRALLDGVPSARLCRLFAVACCRAPEVWAAMPDDQARTAVRLAERFADGLETAGALQQARNVSWAGLGRTERGFEYDNSDTAKMAAHTCMWPNASHAAISAFSHAVSVLAGLAVASISGNTTRRGSRTTWGIVWDSAAKWALKQQAEYWVRILRPEWSFDPAWRTEPVVNLAAAIYESHGADTFPVLADALEEAGCLDPRVLDYLRAPATFFRGEWVVDQCLGKRDGSALVSQG